MEKNEKTMKPKAPRGDAAGRATKRRRATCVVREPSAGVAAEGDASAVARQGAATRDANAEKGAYRRQERRRSEKERGFTASDLVPFAVFRTWLKENFDDPTREFHAREALKGIRQEGSIKEYRG